MPLDNPIRKPVLAALQGEAVWPPPAWMMRQAGRYLPEYRAVRATRPNFLDLCYDPAGAAEVTLQPIRRFGFDAAILFSDILVVPDALGQKTWFAQGEGPRLDPVAGRPAFDALDPGRLLGHLAPVFETIRRVKAALPREVALLGFCGAPWTVATYMIAGRGTPDQAPAHSLFRDEPDLARALIDLLVEASITYLDAQIEAGVDAVQIFESHGGSLGDEELGPRSLEPLRRIVEGLKARHPGTPVIVFLRGAGSRLPRLVEAGIADGIGLDQHMDLGSALAGFPPRLASQGNLDPETLIAGGEALDRAVDTILAATRGRPHIFNLGHGITPQTPIPHVEQMLARVRAAR